ncbi:MAG: BA14K family protein [Pseudomonadota bacterium]
MARFSDLRAPYPISMEGHYMFNRSTFAACLALVASFTLGGFASSAVAAVKPDARAAAAIGTLSAPHETRSALGIQVAQRARARGPRARQRIRRNGRINRRINRQARNQARRERRRERRRDRRRNRAIGIGAAVIGGLIINEALRNNRGRSNSAIARCEDDYRSFRRSDGTFQPFGGGPRRLCPYLR